jgi:hypothetical protein
MESVALVGAVWGMERVSIEVREALELRASVIG